MSLSSSIPVNSITVLQQNIAALKHHSCFHLGTIWEEQGGHGNLSAIKAQASATNTTASVGSFLAPEVLVAFHMHSSLLSLDWCCPISA